LKCQNRRITGIPRTILRIIHCLSKAGYPNLRYCYLDEQRGNFFELDVDRLLAQFPEGGSPTADHSSGARLLPIKARCRAEVKSMIRSLPPYLQNPLRSSGRQALAVGRAALRRGIAAVHVANSLARRLVDRSRRAVARLGTIDRLLGPKDLIVSLGAGWTMPKNNETIWRLRNECGFRLATLIYDLIPILFPQFFGPGFPDYYDHWIADMIWSSDLLLTISNNSRQDIEAYCQSRNMPCPPIDVLRLGEDFVANPLVSARPRDVRFHADKPFVLNVGTVEVRKNHLALYQAWRRLSQELGPNTPQLVIVGGAGWLSGDVLTQMATDPLTKRSIIVLNNINDHELGWLYEHCLFTVFPAHYEGWGLPIAESLNRGKYCIASSTSSMPEIGGDLVGMHRPDDVPTLHRLIRQALEPEFLVAREQEIRAKFQPTTWMQCTAQLASRIRERFHLTDFVATVRESSDEGPANLPVPDAAAHSRGTEASRSDSRRLSA
jgi:glycosyltransferase involved in cell wall biosynthesis